VVPVWEQFQTFFFTVLLGCLIGFIVDGYRVFMKLVPGQGAVRALRAAGDILLWVFLALLVFFLLLLNNWGEVRAYLLAGMALGFAVYRRYCSRPVVGFWRRLFYLVGKLGKLAINLLLLPFRLVQKVLFVPLGLLSMGLDWCWRLLRGILRRLGLRRSLWREVYQKFRRR